MRHYSKELLEEIALRFILACPDEELKSIERIMFLIEQGHWYYEDFAREHDTVRRCKLTLC